MFMNKILGIIILGLFLSGNAYAGVNEPGYTYIAGCDKNLKVPHNKFIKKNLKDLIKKKKTGILYANFNDKKYYSHSLYPGGLKTKTFREMNEKHPERIIEEAVKGMLPKNKLGKSMIKKLKVFSGPIHDHESQQPIEWNPKI